MATLTGRSPKDTYGDLLQVSNANDGVDSTLRFVSDGKGTNSSLKISSASAQFTGTLTSTGLLTTTAGIVSGSNIISDTDSTDDLGSTGVRWANLWVDNITMGGTIAGAVATFSSTMTVTGLTTATGGIVTSGTIIFEGATADAHETTLTVVDPTADRTVSLPNATDTLVGKATTDTLTNKTLTSPVLNTGLSGTAFLDEDDMSSNSATKAASQQSIKAYVDAQVDTADTLSEILAIGNTTGGTDVSVSTDDKVQFRDAAIYINSSTDGQLDIVADTEIQIAATTIDINGAVALNGALTGITDITASGVITGGTVEATTDTAAGDNAAMGYTAAEGLILTGQGSSSDVTIKNDADATVMSIATGTTNTTFAGDVDIGGDADTGLTLVGANNLGIQTGGTTRFNVDSIGKAIFTNRMVGNDGSAALPAFGFTSDANTGMYRVGSDSLGFSTGSTNRLTIDSTGDATFSGDVIVDTGANAASITINSPSQTWSGGENLGELNWYTEDTSGAGPANVAAIKVTSTGTNTLPKAAMVFQTSNSNATATTALTLDSTQNATFAGEIRADYASANIIAEFGGTGETGQIGFSFTGTDVGGLDYAYNTRTTVGMRAWTPNSYPITIDAGGGSSSSNKIFFKTNTSTTALTISSTDTATFAGAISKASGSFKIPHPLPELNETHNLVHSFVESPRAENLYSGMATLIDGTASVNIDTHSGMTEGTFEALNTLLTHSSSNESGYSPVKCSVVNNVITINCQDATSTDKVYWEVRGERKDQHMIDTEWTDDEGHVIVEPEVVAETETEAEAEA